MNKKIIFGIIIGLIFGSVGVYAGTKFYASDVSVSTSTGSSLGSDATLQDSLDELYSIADKYDELKSEINSMLDKMYPVGSIYISTDIKSASDVSKKFGGTWEVYGSGRTLVGVNTSDTNFNEPSKTGGSSTTTLSISNLPHHSHIVTGGTYTTSKDGNHSHSNLVYNTGGSLQYDWHLSASQGNAVYSAATATAGDHTHTVTIPEKTTSSVGSDQAFSVQNPYITVYMYKRVS